MDSVTIYSQLASEMTKSLASKPENPDLITRTHIGRMCTQNAQNVIFKIKNDGEGEIA